MKKLINWSQSICDEYSRLFEVLRSYIIHIDGKISTLFRIILINTTVWKLFNLSKNSWIIYFLEKFWDLKAFKVKNTCKLVLYYVKDSKLMNDAMELIMALWKFYNSDFNLRSHNVKFQFGFTFLGSFFEARCGFIWSIEDSDVCDATNIYWSRINRTFAWN